MEKDDIIIRSAIMHILDSTVGMPVLSDTLLNLNPDLNDFLRNHIYKVISGDDLKICVFDEEKSSVYRLIQQFSEDMMVEITKKLAELLYSIMNSNTAIPGADVFFVTYQMNSQHHLAILKINYKEVYMHYTSMNLHWIGMQPCSNFVRYSFGVTGTVTVPTVFPIGLF